MDKRAPEILKPSLLAGVTFGAAGALPVLELLNCACCGLMVGSGLVAAWLYSRECRGRGVTFHAGPGAWVGLVSGLFYALAATIVNGLKQLLLGAPDLSESLEMFEQLGLPPEQMDVVAMWLERLQGPLGIVVGFFITLLLAAVFSTVGGLIGGAVFRVEPPPAGPPPSSPPTPGWSEPSGP
jgi:hypothetical protein